MSTPTPASQKTSTGSPGFWLIIGIEALFVPFVLFTVFFGVMAWDHFSSEDKLQLLLLATYPIWLVVVSVLGHAQLKRKQSLKAFLFALSPLLLLVSWLPTIANV